MGRFQLNWQQAFKELLNIVTIKYQCGDTHPKKNCFLLHFGKNNLRKFSNITDPQFDSFLGQNHVSFKACS
jgi:hypothetical protein